MSDGSKPQKITSKMMKVFPYGDVIVPDISENTMSKRELICMNCGFITYGYKDMVEHLANYINERGNIINRRLKDENCFKQQIKLGRKNWEWIKLQCS